MRLLRLNFLKDIPPRPLPNGDWILEAGSVQYADAVKACNWGRPRGYAVTWRTKHNKPHLYWVGRV